MAWVDERLEELYQKGKGNWDENDWEDYFYCMNTNAERDYFDSKE